MCRVKWQQVNDQRQKACTQSLQAGGAVSDMIKAMSVLQHEVNPVSVLPVLCCMSGEDTAGHRGLYV